jgi:hypothetical protein
VNPDYIGVQAEALLAAAADALAERAPERQFVSWAPPAWDLCKADQLTVHVGPYQVRQQLAGRGGCQLQLVPTYTVELVRCHPALADDGPPNVDAMHNAALGLNEDVYRVQQYIVASGVLGGCDGVLYREAIHLGPSGGVAGWSWPIELAVNDTDAAAGS